jgi:hypothetical protein
MITTNILDANGNVIGTIDFEDGTPQDVIDAAVALYTYRPPQIPTINLVAGSIQQAVQFGQTLIFKFAAQNVLNGITQSGKTIAVAQYLQTLGFYLNSGSLYAAITEIQNLLADTSSTKASLAPFVTNDALYAYLNSIQQYLQIQVTPNPNPGS